MKAFIKLFFGLSLLLISSISYQAKGHHIVCCTVDCAMSSCAAFGSGCGCSCIGGHAYCDSWASRVVANPTQMSNTVAVKDYCSELNNTHGDAAASIFQQI